MFVWRQAANEKVLEILFNMLITHFPSHRIRQHTLRMAGAQIGPGVSILRATTILAPHNLIIGKNTSIGFRCMIDARAGIDIGSEVVIASDVHLISASHEVNSDDFHATFGKIEIAHHAWIASRATLLPGVKLHEGSIVAACALVNRSISRLSIVAGIPARKVGERQSNLSYNPSYRPIFF